MPTVRRALHSKTIDSHYIVGEAPRLLPPSADGVKLETIGKTTPIANSNSRISRKRRGPGEAAASLGRLVSKGSYEVGPLAAGGNPA